MPWQEPPSTVAASPAPHAEILEVAKEILAEKDITLDIMEFTDYVQPNNVVESGEVDANYFQHTPYLDDFNAAERHPHRLGSGDPCRADGPVRRQAGLPWTRIKK